MLLTEIIAVYTKNHKKTMHTLSGEMKSYCILKTLVYIVTTEL
jgi:hypothetical protein